MLKYRKGVYNINTVFNTLGDAILINRGKEKVLFDGELVKANSQRLQVFYTKGCVCCACGLVATHFALEKHTENEGYHLNLYGIDAKGKEVLFTKDHIIPKSKGGKNSLENYQTMCSVCNEKKKDTYND